ncbi:MAG: tetratricopeptide repeat protein [Geminicoccaceae bacterium]
MSDRSLRAALEAHRRGDGPAAQRAYEQVLAETRSNQTALINLAALMKGQGQPERAVSLLCRALEAGGDPVSEHFNLGNAFSAGGDVAKAIGHWTKVLAIEPHHGGALTNLGLARRRRGELHQAQELLARAVDATPGRATSWSNLGLILIDRCQFKAAEQCLRRALALEPVSESAAIELAHCLKQATRYREAWDILERISNGGRKRPRWRMVAGHLAAAEGQNDVARSLFEGLLADGAGKSDETVEWAALGLAGVALREGAFGEGFRLFERRYGALLTRPAAPGRWWQGEPLCDKTLLLLAEQGLGDCLQFLRFVPRLVPSARRILVALPAPLRDLVAAQNWPVEVVDDRRLDALGDVDFHLTLPSLPARLGVDGPGGLGGGRYLVAARRAQIDQRFRAWRREHRLLIGIAWAGNAANPIDHARSARLTDLLALAALPQVKLISLQPDKGEEIRAAGADALITDLSADIRSLADTAAMIGHLDLTISVDTAVAHLAGALGAPVTVLLAPNSDWRWPHEGRSFWYPQASLRWRRPEQSWSQMFEDLAAELAQTP